MHIQVLRRIPYWAMLALLVYMPFHIFLSQSLSLVTGGLEAWKIGKDVFLIAAVLFTVCLVFWQRAGDKLFYWLFGLSAAYLLVHLLLWWLYPEIYQRSAILGTIYNMRLPGFLLLGYGAILLHPAKFAFSSVLRLAIIVGSVVAILGIVQYFLPKDILTHVGYGIDRGVRPSFFIDDHPDFPRVMSTLREPNALGAYLIVPIVALVGSLLRAQNMRVRVWCASLLFVQGLALFLTSSRSAWLGAALAVALVVWWSKSSEFVHLLKRWWQPAVVVGACLLLVGLAAQDSQFVKSHITHSTPELVEDLDSNDYHWLLFRQGVEAVVAQPFGHGPGTAGIVSIQNPNGAFLTENYYVQIAYEVGVVGLALFAIISVVVYVWLYRRHDFAAAVLLASFWAYVLTNSLLHTWSNEAVAAQWWLLAGLGLCLVVSKKSSASANR